MIAIFQKIQQRILEFPFADFYSSLRVIFIFLDIILFIAFIWVFLLARKYRPNFLVKHQKSKMQDRKDPQLIKRWHKILLEAEKNPPHSFVLAIIEADKFVDEALKKIGLGGEHMADRLERLGAYDLKTLDHVWRAHRIRNELVHSPDFQISPVDARGVLNIYEKFLEELGIL
jgi:hypothetical protein